MSDFWSRRKAAVEAEDLAEAQAAAAAAQAEREAALAEKTDEELLQELGLPEPESLSRGGDFRQFLAEAVPARLRTRALRHLWRVDPVLANLDGLVDYGEDFTNAATVIENMQSTYQVGRGMQAHVEEMARQAEAAEAGDATDRAEAGRAAEERAEAEEARPGDAPADALAGEPAAPAAAEAAGTEAEIEAETVTEAEAMAPARRRMTFAFEDQRTG